MAQAFLINPPDQSIEAVEVADNDDIKRAIGFDTLESDAIGNAGDHLFFDEECFIRGTTGRFQIDSLVPVSGTGVVVGVSNDGSRLVDAAIAIDDLRGRVRFQ
jgi:hypothetical protein